MELQSTNRFIPRLERSFANAFNSQLTPKRVCLSFYPNSRQPKR